MTDILLDEVPYIPGTQDIGFHLQYDCVKGYTHPRALEQNNYRFDRVWLDQEAPCR